MKRINYIITFLCCAILSATFTSCEEDPNDWPTDPSYDVPFRPVHLGTVNTEEPTSAMLSFSGIVDAQKYIFEFSEGDSLLFNNIVRTVEVYADTLTVYIDHPSPTSREYRVLFENLKGITPYSVRLKGVDIYNRETGYVTTYFKTPEEQAIYRSIFTPNTISIEWNTAKEVSSVKWGEVIAGQEITYQERDLTAEESASGIASISGLKSGTEYSVLLMLGDQQRGSVTNKTTGALDATFVTINPGDAINDILKEQAGNNVKNIVLLFPASGTTYECETLTIPAGIEQLYIEGAKTFETTPELYMARVVFEGPGANVFFNNINMDARSHTSNYVINVSNENCFNNLTFSGCEIRNIGRSLVRLSAADLKVGDIRFDNCIFKNISASGYGLFNMGNDEMEVNSISITNSTMMEMGDQLMDIRAGLDSVTIDHCIFSNYTLTNLDAVFHIRAKPGNMSVTNTIFSGTNAGKPLNASSNNASAYLTFDGCYLTSDIVENTNAFTNITKLTLTSEELFVDPLNGDFHLKEDVRFQGEGTAGDPRWW